MTGSHVQQRKSPASVMVIDRKRTLFVMRCVRLRRRGLCWTLALPLVVVNSVWVAAEPATRIAAEATPAQKLLAAARQMVGDFKVTRYSHKTLIDRTRGICEVDCSGFIVALLKQTSRVHLRQIVTTHKRPLAEDFYQAFAPSNGRNASRVGADQAAARRRTGRPDCLDQTRPRAG